VKSALGTIALAACAAAPSMLGTGGNLATATVGPADVLAFAVPSGAEVEKTFSLEHQLVAQKIQLEGVRAGLLSQQGVEVASKIELSVLDTYKKVEAGRPLELQRQFKNCAMHVDLSTTDGRGTKTPDTADADTPLQLKSVVFTWVPEEKGYGRYYDHGESLEEYLAGLSEDLDLRCLLPEHATEKGGEWTIDPVRLVDVFVAGGEIPLGFVRGGGGTFARVLTAGVGGQLQQVFGGTVKGNVSARWTETREASLESAGARFAVVQLTVAIETERERSDTADAPSSGEKSLDAREVEHSGVHWKFDGSGTLIWNLTAGRFENFDLVGREEVTSDLTLDMGGERSRQVLTMAGSLKLGAKAGLKKK
jgi:hypothetical protein